ncbi:Leucine carboxyl methyltransferase 1 [Chlorella vulgaris]
MLSNRLGGPARSDDRADDGVRDTNDDAQLSKLSCVRLGYFQDSFVHHFVRRPTRRSPLINRGYYSRYAALRSLLLQFLALGLSRPAKDTPSGASQSQQGAPGPKDSAADQLPQPVQQPEAGSRKTEPQSQQQQQAQQRQAAPVKRQVLVLGAGYDTTFFQLAKEGIQADKYVELDFKQASRHTQGTAQREGRVLTERYCLLPVDLRDLEQLEAALQEAGLDPAAPTYILSECVLVYLQPQHSQQLVRWLAEHLQCAAMAVYEQIQPDDAFGRQMLLNLESRGCALLGIEATPTLDAQQRRFTSCGWHRADAHTMQHVYSDCTDPADRRRIERLEMFDEFEEWHLIQQHYCIAVGVKDRTGLLDRFGLPRYAAQPFVPPAVPAALNLPPRFTT